MVYCTNEEGKDEWAYQVPPRRNWILVSEESEHPR